MAHDTRPHVVVIGGGIAGTIVADLAAAENLRLTCFRLSDNIRPEADSLRNHGWQQSGLMYAEDSPALAKRMHVSGVEMLTRYAQPRPRARGIFRVEGETAALQFEETARRFRLDHIVKQLETSELERRLGIFHDPATIAFEVPDAPFSPGRLLEAVRASAKSHGAQFWDIQSRLELIEDAASPCGVLIKSDGIEIRPDAIVLAAGGGIPTLMGALDVPCPLQVVRSALLVMEAGDLLADCPLLVDRHTELAVVKHTPIHGAGARLLIGSRGRVALEPAAHWHREVCQQEVEQILELLPPPLRPLWDSEEIRAYAGHKTELLGPDGVTQPTIHVQPLMQFPRVLLVVPWKATMALVAASAARDELLSMLHGAASGSTAESVTKVTEWAGRPLTQVDRPDVDERRAI